MHSVTPERKRERILGRDMAERLHVSLRAFANLKKLGMPYCQVGGTVWYEPETVHRWLDQFNQNGVPGKRFHRNPAVLQPPVSKSGPRPKRATVEVKPA